MQRKFQSQTEYAANRHLCANYRSTIAPEKSAVSKSFAVNWPSPSAVKLSGYLRRFANSRRGNNSEAQAMCPLPPPPGSSEYPMLDKNTSALAQRIIVSHVRPPFTMFRRHSKQLHATKTRCYVFKPAAPKAPHMCGLPTLGFCFAIGIATLRKVAASRPVTIVTIASERPDLETVAIAESAQAIRFIVSDIGHKFFKSHCFWFRVPPARPVK